MGFSPNAILNIGTVDQSAPGAPGLAGRQVGPNRGEYYVTPPLTDANGQPLTGLTYGDGIVVDGGSVVLDAFANDFEGAMAAFPSSQRAQFDIAAGGPVVTVPFNIPIEGHDYGVMVRVSDDPRPNPTPPTP